VDQQSSFPRPEPKPSAREYRLGIEDKRGQKLWQKLWHFNDKCESYPTRNFMSRTDMPSDDELCSRCFRAA